MISTTSEKICLFIFATKQRKYASSCLFASILSEIYVQLFETVSNLDMNSSFQNILTLKYGRAIIKASKIIMRCISMKNKGFEKAVVIFIDILGTKDRTNFDDWYKISDIFYKTVEREKELDSTHPWTVYKREISIFSDCAYIVYDFKDDIDDSRKIKDELIIISLYNTEKLICEFLTNDFIARGAITYGDIYYETNRGLFFGPAMNRAYELESKYAKYPRIIIDPCISDEIYSYNMKKYRSDSIGCAINGEIIKKDTDEIYFLHYLNSFQLGYVNIDYENIFEFIKNERNKNRETTELKESINKKYDWLEKYVRNSLPLSLNPIY